LDISDIRFEKVDKMNKNKIKELLRAKWEDCEYFAEGGNSWVYSATSDGSKVAIKVFRRFNNPERYPRFIEEIKVMQSLKDVNGVVAILALNEQDMQRDKKSMPELILSLILNLVELIKGKLVLI
jgi:predicted Ser/Thr protein kinase